MKAVYPARLLMSTKKRLDRHRPVDCPNTAMGLGRLGIMRSPNVCQASKELKAVLANQSSAAERATSSVWGSRLSGLTGRVFALGVWRGDDGQIEFCPRIGLSAYPCPTSLASPAGGRACPSPLSLGRIPVSSPTPPARPYRRSAAARNRRSPGGSRGGSHR